MLLIELDTEFITTENAKRNFKKISAALFFQLFCLMFLPSDEKTDDYTWIKKEAISLIASWMIILKMLRPEKLLKSFITLASPGILLALLSHINPSLKGNLDVIREKTLKIDLFMIGGFALFCHWNTRVGEDNEGVSTKTKAMGYATTYDLATHTLSLRIFCFANIVSSQVAATISFMLAMCTSLAVELHCLKKRPTIANVTSLLFNDDSRLTRALSTTIWLINLLVVKFTPPGNYMLNASSVAAGLLGLMAGIIAHSLKPLPPENSPIEENRRLLQV